MEALTERKLNRFFEELARRIPCRVKIVLTGGSEAMVLGGSRVTGDIDFGVSIRAKRFWPDVERAIGDAANVSRVVVQYSADIDRWSSISVPVRRRRTRLLRNVGGLAVHVLDPVCWAVYKLARFLESDIEDLCALLRKQSVQPRRLARLCGDSLKASPRSPALILFRRQVEHFFRKNGRDIWGTQFDPTDAIATFHRAAGIKGSTRK